jgi:hypothetical protein
VERTDNIRNNGMSSGSDSEYNKCGVGTSDVKELEGSRFYKTMNILFKKFLERLSHVLGEVYIRPSFIFNYCTSWRQKELHNRASLSLLAFPMNNAVTKHYWGNCTHIAYIPTIPPSTVHLVDDIKHTGAVAVCGSRTELNIALISCVEGQLISAICVLVKASLVYRMPQEMYGKFPL